MFKDITLKDIVSVVIMIGSVVTFWIRFAKKDALTEAAVNHLSRWAEDHNKACTEQKATNNEILTELKSTNSRLVTLAEAHEKRLDRVERTLDERA